MPATGHRAECGEYVDPGRAGYTSVRLREYQAAFRRWPVARPTAEQLAPDYVPDGQFLLFPGGGGRWVRHDEKLENPFMQQGGGGGAAGQPNPASGASSGGSGPMGGPGPKEQEQARDGAAGAGTT